MHDKNLREIYEGNLVRIGGGFTFRVSFSKLQVNGEATGFYLGEPGSESEIVGNIYEETPGLLTAS